MRSTERCKMCGISKIQRFTKIVDLGHFLRREILFINCKHSNMFSPLYLFLLVTQCLALALGESDCKFIEIEDDFYPLNHCNPVSSTLNDDASSPDDLFGKYHEYSCNSNNVPIGTTMFTIFEKKNNNKNKK